MYGIHRINIAEMKFLRCRNEMKTKCEDVYILTEEFYRNNATGKKL